ncbi:hypothetical protein [Nocardiopsis sp. MG754419]|uniref:hypothetical protein n=1 Tax=Nocardiopsis sp. MG754419 TaxID=2259865 RepID=UPI001BA966F8|nr:hypothetical protein [Nocardiopsis sp. MG754419]MBR8741976.1 hypothetical protein [Nocardiopsis sp. MG754419]
MVQRDDVMYLDVAAPAVVDVGPETSFSPVPAVLVSADVIVQTPRRYGSEHVFSRSESSCAR